MFEGLELEEARLHLLISFDVGFEVRLSQIPVLFGTFQRDPVGFNFLARSIGRDTQPVRIVYDSIHLTLGGKKRIFQTYVTFFDVGSISLELTCPLDTKIEDLPKLAMEVHSSKDLIGEARRIAQSVFDRAKAAIVSPGFFPNPSLFVVFNIQRLNQKWTYQSVVEKLGPILAQTLRVSDEAIGSVEVQRTLNPYITYSDQDVVFTSSNVAVIFDETSSEVVDIFELLNMQFLELKFIDARLDKTLQELYDESDQSKNLFKVLSDVIDRSANKLNTTHLDSTIIVERVELSFKFANDSYLVRIYELCVQKMFLNSYSQGIERKLRVIRDIMTDRRVRANTLRMEVLEWLIVILIAVDVVPNLFRLIFNKI
jgi:hypothetical protein